MGVGGGVVIGKDSTLNYLFLAHNVGEFSIKYVICQKESQTIRLRQYKPL